MGRILIIRLTHTGSQPDRHRHLPTVNKPSKVQSNSGAIAIAQLEDGRSFTISR